MKVFQIAIDGPVAAGKGTVSKKLAERLGFVYVDTGAMYRAATLLATRNHFDFVKLDNMESDDVVALAKLVELSEIELRRPQAGEKDGGLITVLVNGEDVSWAIRDEAISSRVAIVAKIAEVRVALVKKQREIAERTSVVMEGRDITFRVLPEADLKIFLDAREEVRIQRRVDQLNRQGVEVDKKMVAWELRKRDELDMNRETDPLKVVEGVWHLDASEMGIDETVELIVKRVKEMGVEVDNSSNEAESP